MYMLYTLNISYVRPSLSLPLPSLPFTIHRPPHLANIYLWSFFSSPCFCLSDLFVCLSFCVCMAVISLSVCMSVYLHVCLYTCMHVCLYAYMCVCLYVCMPSCTCLSVCPHVFLSVMLSVYLHVCLFMTQWLRYRYNHLKNLNGETQLVCKTFL